MRLEGNSKGQRWLLGENEARVIDTLRADQSGLSQQDLQSQLDLSKNQVNRALRGLLKFGLVRRIPPKGGVITVWQAWTGSEWPSSAEAKVKQKNLTRIRMQSNAINLPRVREARERT